MIPDLSNFQGLFHDFEIVENQNRDGVQILRLKITFIDFSILFVTDIFVSFESRRKYSFHWQTADSQFISRWDNAPHFAQLTTFPHHQHISETIAIESPEMTLINILEIIQEKIKA